MQVIADREELRSPFSVAPCSLNQLFAKLGVASNRQILLRLESSNGRTSLRIRGTAITVSGVVIGVVRNAVVRAVAVVPIVTVIGKIRVRKTQIPPPRISIAIERETRTEKTIAGEKAIVCEKAIGAKPTKTDETRAHRERRYHHANRYHPLRQNLRQQNLRGLERWEST